MSKHKITEIRHLTDLTYVLRMERNGLHFQTGQFIILNLVNSPEQREYSVYSGENDDSLEILVREVVDGKISPKLKRLKENDFLEVDGPFGFFKFDPKYFDSKKFLFVATGTGISPFHSFIRTFPGLEYKLIHGVRFGDEAYEHDHFDPAKVILCTSAENGGHFNGRVTEYLVSQKIDEDTNCFLCGNSEMIYEVFDILVAKGVPVSNIYSEVYF
ncbi:MAG: ferredoxin--NADP reductase [Prolixibacteraceae bacterium]